jgi:hypothetical protein
MKTTAFLLGAALVLLGTQAAAQSPKIYRCGPDGREYSQVPCKDGKLIDATDARSAEQQRDAQGVAESQKRLATSLEKERREREAKAAGTGPAALTIPKPESAASSPADWCDKQWQPRKKASAEQRNYCNRMARETSLRPAPSKPRT